MRHLFIPILALALACSTVLGPVVHAAPSGLDTNGHLLAASLEGRDGFSYARLQHGVQFRVGDVVKNVIFYGPGTVRVNANLGRNHWTSPSLVVVDKPGGVPFELEDRADTLTIKSTALRVAIDRKTGALSFMDGAGRLYTREAGQPHAIKSVEISGAPSYEVENRFTLKPEEAIFGFGYTDSDAVNRRNQDLLLVQTNLGIIIPVMMSSERYGILWDTYSKMRFQDGPQGARLWAESAPGGVDYYFMGGRSMDEVVGKYRRLTGAAPMFPKQAFGLFMSKERYPTQQRIVEVAETFRKERFPLDYIVQDWQYWGGEKNGVWDGQWSGMVWDAERFPDPAGMARELHGKLNVKLMASIWPGVGNDTALARELDAKNLRFEPLHWISKKARIYDAFSDEARRIYFKHAKKGLLDIGVDALWMDGTEVEVGGAAHDPREVEADIKRLGMTAIGDTTRYLNVYTLVTTRGVYEGQRAAADLGGKRVLTLTRSAWAGQQRYAAMSWSGDTTASWATLRAQIAGGLNVAMAGQPYWTQDTGGFFVNFGGGQHNPAWREMYARWNQFGIFNPVYRIHGTSVDREPYLFKTLDPPVYASLLGAAQLRMRLLPYLYGLAWRSTHEGYTMMRGLAMDFPDQPALRKVDDTYMFGPAFLVQPITRAMFHPEAPPPLTVPATQLRTPDGQRGLVLEYFDGVNFDKPASRTVDTVVAHHWPDPPLGSIPPGLKSLNNFSARWTGEVAVMESGDYELGVEGDDGFRMWLGDQLVVDEWAVGGARFKGHVMTLREGQVLKVRVDFFQAGGGRVLRLAWRTPAQRREQAEAQRKVDQRQATLLPAGCEWFDFWTGQRHAGGQRVERDYTLDEFPLFVRAGAIVPLGPVVEHTGQAPDAPWEIRIYPGADGHFTLYEDDGETYRYERGERAITALRWDESHGTLHIGARQGRYPGMAARRDLQVRLMAPPGRAEQTKTIRYDGRALSVPLGQ